jgi:phage host-nuclease inhibitor protein Gam
MEETNIIDLYRYKWNLEKIVDDKIVKIDTKKVEEYNNLKEQLESLTSIIFFYEEQKAIIHSKMMKLSKDILIESGVLV